MSFNPMLSYMLDRIQGFSCNLFRLETDNGDTANPGQIITLSMPDNTLLNLRSLQLYAEYAGSGTTAGVRLVPIDQLAERIEVTCGGIVLSQGNNFTNTLLAAMVALGEEECDQNLGHKNMYREQNQLSSDITAYTTTDNEGASGLPFAPYAMTKFMGFMDSAAPQIIDLSLLPSLKIRISLAPKNVLSSAGSVLLGNDKVGATAAVAFATNTLTSAAGAGNVVLPAITATGGFTTATNATASNATYQLSSLHATVECCNLSSSLFDQAVAAQMAQQGFLEIPFKTYISFQETHSGSSKFSVSSASIDKVITCWRASDYDTVKAPVAISGYKSKVAFAVGGSGNDPVNVGAPLYDTGDYNMEKYHSSYFNFQAPSAQTGTGAAYLTAQDVTFQLSLNSAYYPNYPASLAEAFGITKNSTKKHLEYASNMTLDQYIRNYCIQVYRFNMPGHDDVRILSGIDSRSSLLNGIVRTGGTISGNPVLNTFVQCTSVLRVGAGRSVSLLS